MRPIVVLLLLLSISCKKNNEGEQPSSGGGGTPVAEHDYTLEIEGIAADVKVGAQLNVVVHAKKGGQEFTGVEIEIVVAVDIACGRYEHKMRQSADAKGVATFNAFNLEDSWSGACQVIAKARVDGHDLQQKTAFTIKPREKLALVAGQEYVVSMLQDKRGNVYNGFLSLGDCAEAQLLAITDDSTNPIISAGNDGLAINSGKSWRYLAVGVPAAGCKLMFASSVGGQQQEVGTVSATNTSDNFAQGKLNVFNSQQKLAVSTEKLSDASVYVYDQTNTVWRLLDNVNWGNEKKTTLNFAPLARDNRALLAVTHNGKRWWYLAVATMTITEVKVGAGGSKMFGITGAGTQSVTVQLENACGLEVFRFIKTASNKAMLKHITATAIYLTPDNNGNIDKLFAIGSLTADCKFSLKVSDEVVVATKAVAHDYPILTLVKQSGTNKLQLTTNSQGMCRPLYTSTSGLTGFDVAGWNWGMDGRTTINKQWNSDTTQNQALAIHNGNEVFYTRGQ